MKKALFVLLFAPLSVSAFTIDSGAFPKYYQEGDWKTYENLDGAVTSGDFNGDGIGDVAFGNPTNAIQPTVNDFSTATFSSGAVYVYFGSTTTGGMSAPLDQEADVIINGADAEQSFGSAIAAGDFNGDGTDELVVASGYSQNTDHAQLASIFNGPLVAGTYSSSAANTTITGFNSFSGRCSAFCGNDISAGNISVGNLNNDTYEDLLFFGFLYYGGVSGITATTAAAANATGSEEFLISAIGDLNGDGFGDLIGIDNWYSLSAQVLFGSVSLFSGDLDSAVYDSAITIDLGGNFPGKYTLATGDIDNNGNDDLLISDNGYDFGDDDAYQFEEGAVYLVYGEDLTAASHNLSTVVSAVWYGEQNDPDNTDVGIYARWSSLISDLNGDGFPDIVIAQKNYVTMIENPTLTVNTGAINVIYSSGEKFSGVHSLAEADFKIVQDLTSLGADTITQTITDEGAVNDDGFAIGLTMTAVDFNVDNQTDLVFGSLSDYVVDLHQSLTFVSAPFIETVGPTTEPIVASRRTAADMQAGLTVDYNDGTSEFVETFVSAAEPSTEYIRDSGLVVQIDSLGEIAALINYVTREVETTSIATETFDTVETMQEFVLADNITEIIAIAQKSGKVALSIIHPVPSSSTMTTSTIELSNALANFVDPAQTTVEADDNGELTLIILNDVNGETVVTYSVSDAYVLSFVSSIDVPDRGAVTALEPLKNNRLRVHYEDGTGQTFTVFANGAGKPKAALSTDGERIVVVKSNGRQIRVIDAQSGYVFDGMKLRKAASDIVRLKVFNYYGDSGDEIIVSTKLNNVLQTTGITLSPASELKNKNTKRFEQMKIDSYKIVKFKKSVQIKRKLDGSIIVQYKISETAQLTN